MPYRFYVRFTCFVTLLISSAHAQSVFSDSVHTQFSKKKQSDLAFVLHNPGSSASLDTLNYYRKSGMPADSLFFYFNMLSIGVKSSPAGIDFHNHILDRRSVLAATLAPDFTRVTAAGDTIALSQFRNKKYVLLDFRASWNLPCRKEVPALKEVYSVYEKQGLEIISITSDFNPETWKKTIAEDSTGHWKNVHAKPGDWKSRDPKDNLFSVFEVRGIPAYILIDADGVIVLRTGDIGAVKKLLMTALPL